MRKGRAMKNSKPMTRRTMLRTSAAAVAGPAIISGAAPDPVRVGHIGIGTRTKRSCSRGTRIVLEG